MPFPGLLPVPWPSLNHLKVPLKPPDFKNVSRASSVAPIWKPLGQGRTLAPSSSIFDPLGAPWAPLSHLKVSLKPHFFFKQQLGFKCGTNLKNLCSRVELWHPFGPLATLMCPLKPPFSSSNKSIFNFERFSVRTGRVC